MFKAVPQRECSRCHGTYSIYSFRLVARARATHDPRRPICSICEQDERDTVKRANRWLEKIRRSASSHAKKYGMRVRDFITAFMWDLQRMAREMAHAYLNGCPGECGQSFERMGHGHQDITVDIHDRTQAPFFPGNIRYICQSCNRRKGKRSPEENWYRHRDAQLWKAHKKAREADPYYGLPLFALRPESA